MKMKRNENENNSKESSLKNKKYYKGHYLLALYDEDGERLIEVFNRCEDILSFKNMEITPDNVRLIRVEVCRVLKNDNRCLNINGNKYHLYMINVEDDEEIMKGN